MAVRYGWLLLVAAALTPLSWLACNALAGIDSPIVVAQDGCEHASPPPPPPNASDTGDAGLTFALRHLAFTKDDSKVAGPAAPGYDLDGVCTCPGESSCKPVQAGTPSCDLSGGRDNGFLALYVIYEPLIGMPFVNSRIEAGGFGMLLSIEGYNGTGNDPVVTVSFMTASRVLPAADGGKPVWNGSDVWRIDRDALSSDGAPRYRDTAAYVSNGVMVSKLSTAAIYFPVGSDLLLFDVVDLILTARISTTDAGVLGLTEGQFAGRVTVEGFLRSLSQLALAGSIALCTSETSYESLRLEVCKSADILHKAGGSAAAQCDAMSFVLGFDGSLATSGAAELVQKPDASACLPGLRYDCDSIDF